jgi:hypothetical protein
MYIDLGKVRAWVVCITAYRGAGNASTLYHLSAFPVKENVSLHVFLVRRLGHVTREENGKADNPCAGS